MLTPKISPADLKANLPNLAIPFKELSSLKAMLAKGGSALKSYLVTLEKQQKTFLERQFASGKIGWANLAFQNKSVLVMAGVGHPVIGFSGKPIFNPTTINYSPETFPTAAFLAELKVNEGFTNWLYLDKKGFVTIGLGQFVPSAADFIKFHKSSLPMKVMPGNPIGATSITDKLLIDSYNAVKAAPADQLANSYKHLTYVRLKNDADAMKQAVTMMEDAYRSLKNTKYTDQFLSFPAEVQQALVDMVYNMGWPKFYPQFEDLVLAANHRDWDAVAREVNRTGIGVGRNKRTAALVSGLLNSRSLFVNVRQEDAGKAVLWNLTGFKDRKITPLPKLKS